METSEASELSTWQLAVNSMGEHAYWAVVWWIVAVDCSEKNKVATVHHREGKQIALGWLVRPIIECKQGDLALGLLTDAV